jgi:uncharacterized protein
MLPAVSIPGQKTKEANVNQASSEALPVAPSERIVSLDVLRGVAVLGILIMNIQGFSMIQAAYLNPTAYGDLTGLNKLVWVLSHVFADQKFMTVFSILYGAGIVLLTGKIELTGRAAAGLHYRRTFSLLLIGLTHAYLLWHGDILVTYALCALVVFLLRKSSPVKLLVIGLLVISVSSALYLLFGWSMPYWPAEARQETMAHWKPAVESVQRELAAFRAGWTEQMPNRVGTSFWHQTFVFLIWGGWRAGGLMLVGMALFKWGVLSAERSRRLYATLAAIGLGVGLPIVAVGVVRNFAAGWSLEYSMFLGWQFNYWGSLLVGLGYISAVMLVCKMALHNRVIRLFANVGRMAFTNYLIPTFICTGIFYGHGLGLFGKVERVHQILIVLGVWTVQLVVTPIWLRYFRFGPVEWLWRTLTYMKLQPMRN